MLYLLLGLAALLVAPARSAAYTHGQPAGAGAAAAHRRRRRRRWLARASCSCAAPVGYAMSLATLGSWLLWGARCGLPGRLPAMRSHSPGQTSRIETDHLEVELDHDTGDIRGRVLKGFFAGRDLETLEPAELGASVAGLPFADPQSAQLVEAYLDRMHPDLARGHGARGRGHGRGPDGRMTRERGAGYPGAERRRQRGRHPPRAPRADDEAASRPRRLDLPRRQDQRGQGRAAGKMKPDPAKRRQRIDRRLRARKVLALA